MIENGELVGIDGFSEPDGRPLGVEEVAELGRQRWAYLDPERAQHRDRHGGEAV